MHRTLLVAAIGLVALGGSAFAASPAARPVAGWTSGRIERVDAAAHTLVVTHGQRQVTFVLAPDARLLQGARTVSVADLGGDVGREVRVRYTMQGAQRLADQVSVAVAAPHQARK